MCTGNHKGRRIGAQLLQTISKGFLFTILSVWLVACGGGGNGSDSSDDDNYGDGWVKIVSPEGDYYTMSSNPLRTSGEAFISPTWFTCCSGSAEDTGVTVTWENKTTGQKGYANQQVETCGFMSSIYLCNHTWDASIHAELGENVIRITAEDLSGNIGRDTVTVNLPYLTYSIYGRIKNANNDYNYFPGQGIVVNLTGEGVDEIDYLFHSGTFEFHGLSAGSYVITPSNTERYNNIAYSFDPASRNITTTDTITRGVDFTTTIYSIYGRVGTIPNDIRISGAFGSYSKQTDINGFYYFRVPSGTYTITPFCGLYCFTSLYTWTFSPEKTITVSDQDIKGFNFSVTLTPL